MGERKEYSDEMLKDYISSEIESINKEKEDKKNWKVNEAYKSQIIITDMEG